MDKMSPSQLETYRRAVFASAGLSLCLTTLTLAQISRKGANIVWLLAAPASGLVPLVKRRIEAVERRLPIFLRLNAFTSLSYWVLSLSIVVHVPRRPRAARVEGPP